MSATLHRVSGDGELKTKYSAFRVEYAPTPGEKKRLEYDVHSGRYYASISPCSPLKDDIFLAMVLKDGKVCWWIDDRRQMHLFSLSCMGMDGDRHLVITEHLTWAEWQLYSARAKMLNERRSCIKKQLFLSAGGRFKSVWEMPGLDDQAIYDRQIAPESQIA